jgi:hypothetical protein
MRSLVQGFLALSLVGFGYVLGASGLLTLPLLQAQAQPAEEELSEETAEQIKEAHAAVNGAMLALEGEGRYSPAVRGVNGFVVLAGGANVLEDLEAGRGVDPGTFAALYAGRATDEIAGDLGKDDEGRLTYKGKVVRMYPIARLKRMFAERDRLAGAGDDDPFDF